VNLFGFHKSRVGLEFSLNTLHRVVGTALGQTVILLTDQFRPFQNGYWLNYPRKNYSVIYSQFSMCMKYIDGVRDWRLMCSVQSHDDPHRLHYISNSINRGVNTFKGPRAEYYMAPLGPLCAHPECVPRITGFVDFVYCPEF
jgi:hypothetical protein